MQSALWRKREKWRKTQVWNHQDLRYHFYESMFPNQMVCHSHHPQFCLGFGLLARRLVRGLRLKEGTVLADRQGSTVT